MRGLISWPWRGIPASKRSESRAPRPMAFVSMPSFSPSASRNSQICRASLRREKEFAAVFAGVAGASEENLDAVDLDIAPPEALDGGDRVARQVGGADAALHGRAGDDRVGRDKGHSVQEFDRPRSLDGYHVDGVGMVDDAHAGGRPALEPVVVGVAVARVDDDPPRARQPVDEKIVEDQARLVEKQGIPRFACLHVGHPGADSGVDEIICAGS